MLIFFFQQCAGFLDEVLDIKCAGRDQSLVAIATNSEQVKVYNRDSADCSTLTGHSEVVLCLDVSADGSLLLTSSKVSLTQSCQGVTFLKCFPVLLYAKRNLQLLVFFLPALDFMCDFALFLLVIGYS